MFGTPIQIRIENDAMIISNRCVLPEGWTVDTFMKPHDSVPYNPDIANVFYRAGYIEQWGAAYRMFVNPVTRLVQNVLFMKSSATVSESTSRLWRAHCLIRIQ